MFKKYQYCLEFHDPKNKDCYYLFYVYGAKYKIEDGTVIITGKYQEKTFCPKGYLSLDTRPGKYDAYDHIEELVQAALDATAEGGSTYGVSVDLQEEYGPWVDELP